MLKSDHHQKIKNHEIRKKSLELVFKSTRYVRLEATVLQKRIYIAKGLFLAGSHGSKLEF